MSVQQRRVAEVMQTEVVTLGREDRLDLAEDIMSLGRIRHMPVLEDDRLVGIVSNRDLLAASLSKALEFDPAQRRTFLRSIEVGEVMTRNVVSVESDSALREAADLMLRSHVGCLPVVKPDGTLLGLLTETDLVRAAYFSAEDAGPEREVEAASPDELKARLERELDGLRRLRDELRVQLRLGRAEVRERWEELEERFHEAERRVGRLLEDAEQPLHEGARAVRAVLHELHEAYGRLRHPR